ncbi:hypothetical protein GXB85_04985 [Cellulomonas sp. APG4]|uniref:hypothetical protein n=1 Tax=Cellulomonas sp. APG4 TaxID=1538656 RepID=UPI0013794933|nr:hypothetical protein [Cellulomonas sp. APG4]NCT90307.1 hypothetical protein [Cellulomonas sp. APG4]
MSTWSGTTVDLARFRWPARWARPSRALSALVAGGLAAAAVIGLALLATGQVRDERGVLGLAAVPALVLLALLVLRTRVLRRRTSTTAVRPAAPDEAPAGVTVPFRRDTALLRGLLATYLGLLGVALVLGGLGLAARGDAGFGVAGVLVGVVLLAVAVRQLRAWVATRARPSVLVLTPQGLVQRTARSAVEIAWRDIVSVVPSGDRDPHLLVVVAHRAGAAAPVEPHARRRPGQDRLAPHLRVPAAEVDVDPVLLLAVLQWYLEHPEARPELTSPAGLERVRGARV